MRIDWHPSYGDGGLTYRELVRSARLRRFGIVLISTLLITFLLGVLR